MREGKTKKHEKKENKKVITEVMDEGQILWVMLLRGKRKATEEEGEKGKDARKGVTRGKNGKKQGKKGNKKAIIQGMNEQQILCFGGKWKVTEEKDGEKEMDAENELQNAKQKNMKRESKNSNNQRDHRFIRKNTLAHTKPSNHKSNISTTLPQ